MYTPPKTAAYENLVRLCWCSQYGNLAPEQGAVRMLINAYYPIPKRTSKAKRAAMLAGEILPTVKPDRDNVDKAVSDALNGLAYKDDAYIVHGATVKLYAEHPRVEVRIEPVSAVTPLFTPEG